MNKSKESSCYSGLHRVLNILRTLNQDIIYPGSESAKVTEGSEYASDSEYKFIYQGCEYAKVTRDSEYA